MRGLNGLDGTTGDTLKPDQLDPKELSQGTRFGLSIGLRLTPKTSVAQLPAPPECAASYLEHRPAALVLTATDDVGQGISLRVDLGLFELLHAVSQGFRAPQAFGTYLLDVQRFKERLIRRFGVEGERTNLAFRQGGHLFRIHFEPDGSLDIEVG